MPDPIEQLENFNQQGLPVNPMSASEVRRRGDRMRRRNTALATVGSIAAAVIVIATPLAVVANRNTDSAPPIAPQPTRTTDQTAWLQKIPAGFDLKQGLNGQDKANPPVDTAISGVDDITLCGVPSWSPISDDPVGPAVDVRGATYALPGSDSSAARTLALYADDAEAQAALEALRANVRACPTEVTVNGQQFVSEVLPVDLATDDSFVFTRQVQDGNQLYDLSVYQVARTGNALFVGMSLGAAGGKDVIDYEVPRLGTYASSVLSEMTKTFAAPPGS